MQKFFILILLWFFTASPLQAQAETKNGAGGTSETLSSTARLFAEADELSKSWNDEKKIYKHKYDEFVKKMDKGVRDLDHALDNGDPKLRDQINEQKADLMRKRDHIKRQQADISAAEFVDLTKTKEEIQDKIKDMKD